MALQQPVGKAYLEVKAARQGHDRLAIAADGPGQSLVVGRFGTQLQHLAVAGADLDRKSVV